MFLILPSHLWIVMSALFNILVSALTENSTLDDYTLHHLSPPFQQQQQHLFLVSHQLLQQNSSTKKWKDYPSKRRKRSRNIRNYYSRARSIGGPPVKEQLVENYGSTNWTQTRPESASLSQCNRFEKPRDFFVIGHSGGDPLNFCENTLEATRSALDVGGANAIEIDLTISKDGIIFLWHDPHPLGFLSLIRRMGFALNGRCRPRMMVNRSSHDLTFEEIQEFWFYEEVKAKEGKYGQRMTQRIPTLEEWLNQFGHDPRVRLVWLDVKVNVESKLKFFADRLISLLNKFHITKDRLQFSVREVKIGALLQEHFIHAGRQDLSGLVVTDTQPVVPYVSTDLVHRFDGITKAIPPVSNDYRLKCGCCASLGLPLVVASKWESFKSIVTFNLSQRKLYSHLAHSHIRIYTYTIDDPEQMDWLLEAGVDGIITNHPGMLSQRILLKFNRVGSSSAIIV